MAERRKSAAVEERDLVGARILVVEARFYEEIADALFDGAASVLEAAGVLFDRISVPGALEIPAAVAMALEAAEQQDQNYDAVVALGCVIRGETIHFDIVATESARSLMDLAVGRRLPVGNGILTVENHAQARARASADEADKGGDAARAALAMLRIKRGLMPPMKRRVAPR
jgi:6,7-dimethyl-8-ribityllumazine synthase